MSDRDFEMETILRWDRATPMALFYTADPAEARRWRALGYAVRVAGSRQGRPTGWRTEVPIRAVALLPRLADGSVKVPRYLDSPVVLPDRTIKPRGGETAERIDEKLEENRPLSAAVPTTPSR